MQWLVDIFSRKGDFVYFYKRWNCTSKIELDLNADIITGTN